MQQPISILIVDDEPRNLTVLETVLDDPGYRLHRAESADQALLALVAEEFALIILDIRMPGMSGFELAHAIKARRKTSQIPIIFLTAYYNEDQHVLEGYESGAVDYLYKPVNARVLRSKVAVFAELHRRQREAQASNEALLGEIAERRQVEERLRELNETLEQRVVDRTEALADQKRLYQSVTDNASVALFITDAQQRCVFMNPAAERLTGYAFEELRGCRLADVVLPQRHNETVTPFAMHPLESGSDGLQREARFIHRDGHTYDVSVTTSTLRDDRGASVGAIVEAQDISQRKRAQEQLNDADRRKDEFLATLAHELRNPLAPVRNAVQYLRLKGPPTPELAWARDVIDRQTQAMTRLIDDLMDVSRISRGKIELQRQQVDLATVIANAVETSQPKIEMFNHLLTVNLPPAPVMVDGDPTRLSQVFLNLLNNAAKYTDPGGRIELLAALDDRDVVVSVRDNGIGIPAANLESIFEIFSQVEGALSRSRGGLGIGLSLVKRLVEMHGGSVEARSDGLDQGSEFVVRLPIVVQLGDRAPRRAGAAPVASRADLRILVVEDNHDAAESLSMLLRMLGHRVVMAFDGQEALALAESFSPHVLLCDVGLPKLNGYEVARAIRRESWGDGMVLIAITGWGQDHDRHHSHEAGFDRHLVKPVDVPALMHMLDALPVHAQ
jgi:PAS domain S-box-containing protein